MNTVKINIRDSVEEAPNYNKLGGYKAATLETVEIVNGGMESGRPAFDLVFTDESGQKFIAMVTPGIMESIMAAARGAESKWQRKGGMN